MLKEVGGREEERDGDGVWDDGEMGKDADEIYRTREGAVVENIS